MSMFPFQLVDQVTGDAFGEPKEFFSQTEAGDFLKNHIVSIIEENITEDLEDSKTLEYYKENLVYEPAEDVLCHF